MKLFKTFLLITAISIIPTLFIWAPFYLKSPKVWNIPLPSNGMEAVVSNYDGPLYIVVAKSLYNKEYILSNFSFPLPYEYYAAHLPLYPLLTRLFSLVSGYAWGLLITTLVSSVFAHYFFFKLVREKTNDFNLAIWTTIVFSIFPARWLIVRSVGSPEPLFIGAIIASMFYFQKKKYLLAGIFGAIAALTKSPGILLFPAFVASIFLPRFQQFVTTRHISDWFKSLHKSAIFLLLIPLSLVGLFASYAYTFGDFFAYFNSGNNIHLFFPPFQIFNYSEPWVGTHWLEEVIFIYAAGAFGLMKLIKDKNWTMAWFVGIFFTTTLFISHRDILRYSLPIVPFIIYAFINELQSREAKIVLLLLAVPIYLFSLVFIANNQMPISNWGPLL